MARRSPLHRRFCGIARAGSRRGGDARRAATSHPTPANPGSPPSMTGSRRLAVSFWRTCGATPPPIYGAILQLLSWRPPLADRIRVALLDNHPLFRRGILDALAGTKPTIVAEGEATQDAAQAVLKKKPEIVLMDIDGEGEGIRLAERILNNPSSAKVVILTASSDEEDI